MINALVHYNLPAAHLSRNLFTNGLTSNDNCLLFVYAVQVMAPLVLPSPSCSPATGPISLETTLIPTSLTSSNRHLKFHYYSKLVSLTVYKVIGQVIFFFCM